MKGEEVMESKHIVTWQRSQYGALFGLSILTFVLTVVTNFSGGLYFRKFFGEISPLAVVGAVLVLSALLLHLLRIRFSLAIFTRGNVKGLLVSAALSLPFAAVIILVDSFGVFPVDMNVPFPESLAFYPAIAFVAETLFKVVPLAVVTLLLSKISRRLDRNTVVWAGIAVASLAEALYQASFQIGHSPTWAVVYVGVHLYLFTFLQLSLYKRYDFISMYTFRITYYLIWHVVWGHLRVELLF